MPVNRRTGERLIYYSERSARLSAKADNRTHRFKRKGKLYKVNNSGHAEEDTDIYDLD